MDQQRTAKLKGKASCQAVVVHEGKEWNLGNLDSKWNWRIYKYKLHFWLHHRDNK